MCLVNTLYVSVLLGVDAGGVCHDLFSAFWEIAYKRFFDGDSLLVPMLHPGVDTAITTAREDHFSWVSC